MIAVVLGFNLVAQTHEGVQRPYSHPLSPEVRHALREIVARYPGLELLQMSQSVIEHGFGIQVVLASRTGPQPKAAAELRQSIVDAMGTYRPINIHVVEAARSSLPGAPELP